MDVPTYSPGDLVTANGYTCYVYTHPYAELRDPLHPIVTSFHGTSGVLPLGLVKNTIAMVVASCDGERVYTSYMTSDNNYAQACSSRWIVVVSSGVVGYSPVIWTKKLT